MNVVYKISIIIVIVAIIFAFGFLTSYFIGDDEHNRIVDEYENNYRLIRESNARKDIIISTIGISIRQLEEGFRAREVIARRREQQISNLESTISGLITGTGGEQRSIEQLRYYYSEIDRRLRQVSE